MLRNGVRIQTRTNLRLKRIMILVKTGDQKFFFPLMLSINVMTPFQGFPSLYKLVIKLEETQVICQAKEGIPIYPLRLEDIRIYRIYFMLKI